MRQQTKTESFIRQLIREAASVEVRNLFLLVVSLIAIGTTFYTIVEKWSVFDSFYFSVMTLTTVGYGDLAPATTASKLFTVFFVLGGLGIVLTFLQTLAREQAKDPFFTRLINRGRKNDQD